MHEKTARLKKFFSFVKFSHTIFAMPFALIGFFLAIQTTAAEFSWQVFISVILCMVFARNAAMGFNRYLDRHIDKKNPRTAAREIPSGAISPASALRFVVLNAVLFIATTFFINQLVFFLSPVALLVVLGYSYTKRITALCHFVLGLGLSLAPIGAYLAVTGKFALLPVIYSVVVLFWVSGFDIIYALQDDSFDKQYNLYSIPVILGRRNALILSASLHVLSALLVMTAGFLTDFTWWYWIGVVIFTGLLIYQHTLVKASDLSRVNLAFFTTNGIGSVLFAVFTVLALYL